MAKKCLVFLSIIISITINYIFLNYIEKLDRISCNCSKNWKSKFIRVYSSILIVFQTFILIIDKDTIISLINTLFPFYFITQILGLVYIYSLYTYSNELITLKCDCSERWERELMYYYSIILMFTLLIIFLVNIIYLTSILINSN